MACWCAGGAQDSDERRVGRFAGGQGAQSPEDFRVRVAAVKGRWASDNLAARTAHRTKAGDATDFLVYFQRQWVDTTPEWYIGATGGIAPSTNNATERYIRTLRTHSGQKVASIGQTLQFMLEQVEFEAKNTWCPTEARQAPLDVWRRAGDFLPLVPAGRVG